MVFEETDDVLRPITLVLPTQDSSTMPKAEAGLIHYHPSHLLVHWDDTTGRAISEDA